MLNAEEKPENDRKAHLLCPDPSREVYRVSVKIPPFWPEEPEIWFAQVEGQFALSGITVDETKYNYVIASLSPQYCREIKDIIVSPPSSGRYEKLKTELVRRLSSSQENKVKQLLTHEELGDRKPSQFLRHLQSLAGPNVPDDFLTTIWTSRLPRGLQTVLAGQPQGTSLQSLADLADRVYDVIGPAPAVASTSSAPGSSFESLAREVAELRRQFENFNRQPARQPRSRSRKRSVSGNRSDSRSSSSYRKYPLCWYHSKFGNQAKRCIKPCDYKSENLEGSR